MAEAATFIGLTASVPTEYQAMAIGGLFLASNVGVISGLAGSSAVAELTLKRELDKTLLSYPNKEKVRTPPNFSSRPSARCNASLSNVDADYRSCSFGYWLCFGVGGEGEGDCVEGLCFEFGVYAW